MPPLLREIPASQRRFWKQSRAQQESEKVVDKDLNGFKRSLPENETIVLALMEKARESGEGLFYYLPSRDVWKKNEDVDILPASRAPEPPGASYPHILYLRYRWSAAQQEEYDLLPQRTRYLACNFLVNPPLAETPLYAVQYAHFATCPTYVTPVSSLIVYANKQAYYLTTTTEAAHNPDIGRWNKQYAARGPEPALRLNQAGFLWKQSSDAERAKLSRMDGLQLDTLEDLYDAIQERCRPGMQSVVSTFTAGELQQRLPRPCAPCGGVPLGMPITGTELESAQPPPQKGIKRKRKKAGDDADADADAETA